MSGATMRAPELAVSRWFNAPAPPTLEKLRGTTLVLHAFQMLCPGCIAHISILLDPVDMGTPSRSFRNFHFLLRPQP